MPDASSHTTQLRVRYSETDQMGTYYNSRALEWFEVARTELLRAMGRAYTEMESDGLMLPVREARVEYLGRARYDDLLDLTATARMLSRAQIRIDVEIRQADSGAAVCRGWTVHVVTNSQGRPIRPPQWFVDLLGPAQP